MAIETKLWRDTKDEPTTQLVKNLARGDLRLLVFATIAGTCFGLAAKGGTALFASWQLDLIGVFLSLALILIAYARWRLARTICGRLEHVAEASKPNK